MDTKELKKEIETRFQIILTLSIFFPIFIATFLDGTGMDKNQIRNINITWSALIGFFLFNFVFFELIKRMQLKEWILKWINRTLLFGIGFFIIPIIAFATLPASKPIPNIFYYWSLIVSIFGLFIAPYILFALGGIGSLLSFISRTNRKNKDHLYKL